MLNLRGRPLFGLMPTLVAIAVFLLDQTTKLMVMDRLGQDGQRQQIELIGTWLRLDLVTNTGAAFGLFQNRSFFFTIVAVIAIPALVLFYNLVPSNKWPVRACVGLLLGGTLGNLFDRIQYGYVIDFIDAGVGNLRWWTFNVADSAFVVGVLILAFYFLTSPEKSSASGTS